MDPLTQLMKRTMKNISGYLMTALAFITLTVGVSSCHKHDKPSEDRKVMIMMSLGHNSISAYLKEDIQDMQQGVYLPTKSSSSDVFLIFSKQTVKYKDYSIPTESALIRLYKNKKGVAVMDTLKTYPATQISASASTIREVLTYIQQEFKAKSYGIVFSSHGTGWLPAGFYSNPSKYSSPSISPSSTDRRHRNTGDPVPVPYVEKYQDPNGPATKTAGQEVVRENGSDVSYEMEIEDFAAAIPMHLDYFLFDACLMGGIETAYAFRGVADVVGFSQAEILADGFDYRQLANHLLAGKTPNPVSVCDAFYQHYEKESDSNRSATISLIRTDALEELANACRPLFEKYRTQINSLNSSKVQCFGGNKKYFYDLEDILVKAGAEDLSSFNDAMKKCIVYKNTTGQYYSPYGGTFKVDAFCGLSMYLPPAVTVGKDYLDKYYKGLSWNKATGLVQ